MSPIDLQEKVKAWNCNVAYPQETAGAAGEEGSLASISPSQAHPHLSQWVQGYGHRGSSLGP